MKTFRGQTDAPIELVIAIIIMVTSMGLAFFVISSTNTDKCLATLKTQTQQLQEAVLDVGLGSAGTKKSVQFTMPTCGDQIVEGIQFVRYDTPEFCGRCPGHYDGCWLIVPIAKSKQGTRQVTDAITCIDLPAQRVDIDTGQNDPSTPIDQRCSQLDNQPCPNSDPQCLTDLGINADVLSHSYFRTLGSQDGKQYLITFSKGITPKTVENSLIRVCAVPASRPSGP